VRGVAGQSDQLTVAFDDGGRFSLPEGLAFDGGSGAGTNTLIVRGTSGLDTFQSAKGKLTAGGVACAMTHVSQLRLEGGAGNDTYKLPASSVPIAVVDTLGSNALDFSGAAGGVKVNLGLDGGQKQSIAPWHTTLAITGKIAKLTGTNYADVLTAGAAPTTIIRGLGGNDTLRGGSARSILLGGNGADTLRGGTGGNLMIGGNQADAIYGGAGGNILVGARTTFDDNDPMLTAIASQGANQAYFSSLLKNGSTVLDDAARNRLFGGSGYNWFLPGSCGTWS
jgi:Ca2+-binding RTX toxin-like protein